MTASKSWDIHFFKRHESDDPTEAVPGRDFLDACPEGVAAKLVAVLKAVAEAPPPQFAGGGRWEAMHGVMQGVYEVRVDGPSRRHFRLFCILENPGGDVGLAGPSIVIIDGRSKPFRTELSQNEYKSVRRLVTEYQSRNPRSVEP